MKTDNIIKIDCTTITTWRNTKTNEVFKEKKKIKNISLDFTINLLDDKMINNYFNWNKGCLA